MTTEIENSVEPESKDSDEKKNNFPLRKILTSEEFSEMINWHTENIADILKYVAANSVSRIMTHRHMVANDEAKYAWAYYARLKISLIAYLDCECTDWHHNLAFQDDVKSEMEKRYHELVCRKYDAYDKRLPELIWDPIMDGFLTHALAVPCCSETRCHDCHKEDTYYVFDGHYVCFSCAMSRMGKGTDPSARSEVI
jgi:hypothetical protein